MKKATSVIIKRDKYCYPSSEEWFRPSENYPEYFFKGYLALKENYVYGMVRESFYKMGLDAENYGTEKWNPLKKLVKHGDKVVIKPNLVMDNNPSGEGNECLYTQPSVVAPVIDYVLLALEGDGEIVIGDAPLQSCDFESLVKLSGYDRLLKFYYGKIGQVKISLIDFRELKTRIVGSVYHQNICSNNEGVVINLGKDSEFYGETEDYYKRLRVTNYNPDIMLEHHNRKRHDYYINKNILDADVIFNMPKPKTHRKAGVTIALKNMVGINSRKEYLPHHTVGAKKDGGDEYLNPHIVKKIKSVIDDKKNILIAKKRYGMAKCYRYLSGAMGILIKMTQRDPYYEGSWYGNDTISKTIVDLNKIIFYADKQGHMQKEKQRKYFIVADMIISGEGEGPLMPSKKNVGMLAVGDNPVFFDKVIAKIMGAEVSRIPSIMKAESCTELKDYDGGIIFSNDARWDHKQFEILGEEAVIPYKPASGWKEIWYAGDKGKFDTGQKNRENE